jgi:hypothetical protein
LPFLIPFLRLKSAAMPRRRPHWVGGQIYCRGRECLGKHSGKKIKR